MYKQPQYPNLLSEHAMWLMRAASLGFNIVSEEQFAKASFRSQEQYIESIRKAVLNFRQSNPKANTLLFQADSSITILMVHLKVAISYFEKEMQRSKYLNMFKGHSINATTFYLYEPQICEAIELTRILADTHNLQNQIEQAYFDSIQALESLQDFIYPNQKVSLESKTITSRIYQKIRTLFQ